MSLLVTLNSDIMQAMKEKNKEILTVLRMLKSAVQNEQIKLGRDLTKDEELTVLSREMKQRRDSLNEFEKACRDDLSEKVKLEIIIVEKYLPEQLSTEDLYEIVRQAISKTQSSSSKDFGKVMGVVMPQVKGRADGNHVNTIVKELLNS